MADGPLVTLFRPFASFAVHQVNQIDRHAKGPAVPTTGGCSLSLSFYYNYSMFTFCSFSLEKWLKMTIMWLTGLSNHNSVICSHLKIKSVSIVALLQSCLCSVIQMFYIGPGATQTFLG